MFWQLSQVLGPPFNEVLASFSKVWLTHYTNQIFDYWSRGGVLPSWSEYEQDIEAPIAGFRYRNGNQTGLCEVTLRNGKLRSLLFSDSINSNELFEVTEFRAYPKLSRAFRPLDCAPLSVHPNLAEYARKSNLTFQATPPANNEIIECLEWRLETVLPEDLKLLFREHGAIRLGKFSIDVMTPRLISTNNHFYCCETHNLGMYIAFREGSASKGLCFHNQIDDEVSDWSSDFWGAVKELIRTQDEILSN